MPDLLTLKEAKTALRLRDDDSNRDDLLQEYIDAVTSVVESRVGWVSTRTIDLEIREYGTEVALPGSSVISIDSGSYIDGDGTIDTTGMTVSAAGVLRHTNGSSLPGRPWTITLTVGRDPIPEAIKKGAAEILDHAWQTRRGRPGVTSEDVSPFLVPHRAAAWFVGEEQYAGFA